jgi:apolipoprotein N-acyltransferase
LSPRGRAAASDGPDGPGIGRAREVLLLVLSGASLSLAYPPVDVFPAAFVALVPFFYVVTKTRATGFWSAFRPGLVAGVAFFTPLLYWLVFLSSLDMDNPVLMSGPLLLLVLLQAFYWGLFSAGAIWIRARTRVPVWLALPVLWVAAEQLRSLFVLGFTWGALGYAGVDVVPQMAQFASITGVFGVSFWMALVNALVLAIVLASPGRRPRLSLALALTLAVPIVHGWWTVNRPLPARSIRVAVVQPNIEAKKKWSPEFKDLSFDVLERLTLEAGAEKPDLVIWPETAAPSYLLREPAYMERVVQVAKEVDAPILTGCPDIEYRPGPHGPFRTYNSVLLVTPEGLPPAKYDKIHLVPFGEMIPFESAFPILRRVDFGEADFEPGSERTVFSIPAARFSTLICFEAIFPRLVRQFTDRGAELLVNVTNDVWYGRTSMPFQHASMAVMRSIENRRSLVRSANSGVSLMADPYGRVVARLGIFESGVLVHDLPVISATTFYTRRGDLFPWAALILSALLLVGPAVLPRS